MVSVGKLARLGPPSGNGWDWQRRAACRMLDSEWFFHPDGERGSARRRRSERAQRICRGCPVREQCLRHALQVEEEFGVWGGMDETERRQLIHENRARQSH